MSALVDTYDISDLAPVGHYIALRIGFAFPLEEVNLLPRDWVEHYTQSRFMLFDPVMRWVYGNKGYIRWSELDAEDPRNILQQARAFGLRYGVTVSCVDGSGDGQRSFGTFVRADRDYEPSECQFLYEHVLKLHAAKAPPTNLTEAEIETLRMVKDGQRLKQIAHVLGVSEGAVKQRLRNAKIKLNANTSAQAAAMASEYGLI